MIYGLVVVALILIPTAIAIYRDVRWYPLVPALATVGALLPWWPAKLLVLAALVWALFGPKAGQHAAWHNWSAVVLVLVLLVAGQAQAVTYEHHARRNWVQDNKTGQCLWKLHMDAYWSDSGNNFTEGPRFTKDYDNCIYRLEHWGADVYDRGQYPYGTRWKMLTITAHFEACAVYHGVPGCTSEVAKMWLKVDTDGYVQSDHWIV